LKQGNFFLKVENIKSTAIHIFIIIVLWCKLLSQAQTALTSTQEAYINVPSQLQRRWPILIPISEHWFKRSHTVMNLQGKRKNSQYCPALKQ
jgi:hypothetical protein